MRYLAIIEEIERQRQTCIHHITAPNHINTFEDYRYYVGVMYGLNLAKEIIQNHLKEKNNDTKL